MYQILIILQIRKPSPSIPSVREAYIEMWSIFRLPAVQSLCLVMFVSKIAFAPGDAMNNLKIQGKGMPKEHMAIFGTFLGIISIVLIMTPRHVRIFGGLPSQGRPFLADFASNQAIKRPSHHGNSPQIKSN